MKIEGFVLAGGRSSRMGSPKAALKIGRRTYLAAAVEAFQALGCETVSIVGGEGHSRMRTIPDATLKPHISGPVRGLYTALLNADTEWIALLAVDLPLVTTKFLERLWTFSNDGIDAVIPVQKDGRAQPLCGFYRSVPAIKSCSDAIANEQLSMHSVLDRVNVRRVAFGEYSDIPNAEHILLNVNTPEDHARVLAILKGSG